MRFYLLFILVSLGQINLFSQEVYVLISGQNSSSVPVMNSVIPLNHIILTNNTNGTELMFTPMGGNKDLITHVLINLCDGSYVIPSSISRFESSNDDYSISIDLTQNIIIASLPDASILTLRLYDVGGKQLSHQQFSCNRGKNSLSYGINQKGVFLLVVSSLYGTAGFKIILSDEFAAITTNQADNTKIIRTETNNNKDWWTYTSGDEVMFQAISGDLGSGTIGIDLFISHEYTCFPENGNEVVLEFGSILPDVQSVSISDVSMYSATCNGNVISSLDIYGETYRGFCYATHPSPSINDNCISSGSGTGFYTKTITGLQPETSYYMRAYCTNSAGTSYGSVIPFTTSQSSFVTLPAYDIGTSSAYSGGNIISDGGNYIYHRGIVWNSVPNPTSQTNIGMSNNGEGVGTYTALMSNLSPGTTYYVRAYASNMYDTFYGNQIMFTTLQAGAPTVETIPTTNVSHTGASIYGNVTSGGGSPVGARGFCWSTEPYPSLNDNFATSGTGLGVFQYTLSNLMPGCTYYYRAYATNGVGTSYGNVQSFTTVPYFTVGFGVSDYNGNTYGSVIIGTQEWMAQNCKATHYADGTPIPHITSYLDWGNLADNNTTFAYCIYNNNTGNQDAIYGKLYTYAAAVRGVPFSGSGHIQGVCPNGWHVPSQAEWNILIEYISNDGFPGNVATALKSSYGWSSSGYGYNTYSFSALPGGLRSSYGTGYDSPGSYGGAGDWGYWWTSNEVSSTKSWSKFIQNSNSFVYDYEVFKSAGLSVRCIKD